MQIIMEGVGVVVANLAVNAANRQIHLTQPPGRGIRFLPVNRDVAALAAVRAQEAFALHKHAA